MPYVIVGVTVFRSVALHDPGDVSVLVVGIAIGHFPISAYLTAVTCHLPRAVNRRLAAYRLAVRFIGIPYRIHKGLTCILPVVEVRHLLGHPSEGRVRIADVSPGGIGFLRDSGTTSLCVYSFTIHIQLSFQRMC